MCVHVHIYMYIWTAQATLQCLPINYPKPIMAKLLNSISQAWEMMLSKHVTYQPITSLGSNASQNTMQLALSIKEPAEAQKGRQEEGRDFSGSLA